MKNFTLPLLFAFILFTSLAACKKETKPSVDPDPDTTTQPEDPKDDEEDNESKTPPKEDEITLTVDSTFNLKELPTVYSEAVRLHQNQRYSNFRPTGFMLLPGDTVTLQVEQIQGSRLPQLLVGTYSRYRDDDHHYNPAIYLLHEGENTISDDKGGILWLRYENDAAAKSHAKVTFKEGMKSIPFFQLGKTTPKEWRKMLEEYNYSPDVLLEGKEAYVVVSMDHAWDYRFRSMAEALESIDEILDVEDYISGMDSTTWRDYRHEHKILMTETNDDVYFYSTWFRTAFVDYDAYILLEGHLLKTDGWGVWHELGHQHQQPAWTWDGLMECTVNLYSLRVEKHFGNSSRLRRDGTWSKINNYLRSPSNVRAFNDQDVWVKLGMFWQLWLKYGDEFYIQLHQITRAENPSLPTREDQMLYFMKKASILSGNDLTPFFKAWGFNLPQSAYDELANLNLPVPDEDITKLED